MDQTRGGARGLAARTAISVSSASGIAVIGAIKDSEGALNFG
jgi:hypothetical protein